MSKKKHGPDHGKQPDAAKVPQKSALSNFVSRQVTRRRFLTAGAIGAAGLGIYFGWDPVREAITGEPAAFRKTRDVMDRYGNVVLDETNGAQLRLSANEKQFHGGQGFAEILPDQPALCDAFLAHHDAITQSNVDTLAAVGENTMMFFLEGFAGPSAQWPRDQVRFLDQVQQMEDLLRAQSPQIRRRMFLAGLERMVGIERVQLLYTVTASYRTAARLKGLGRLDRVHGLDVPGAEALTTIFHRRLDQLVAIPEPTDDQCEQFMRDVRAARTVDTQRRHRYYTDTFMQTVQPGMAAKAVLGSSHFRSGDLLEGPGPHPLEDAVLALPDTRMIVSDPRELTTLHGRRNRSNVLVFGPESMTLETVRSVHRELRRRRQGAGACRIDPRMQVAEWLGKAPEFRDTGGKFAQSFDRIRREAVGKYV